MLSSGPLRLETARSSSQASCAIQLGCRSVGWKSESVRAWDDVEPKERKSLYALVSVHAVVQFYPWFKFCLLCFGYGNLMIMSLKQRK